MPPPRPSSFPLAAEAAASYRLAHAVGLVLNPLIFPALLFGLVLAHFGAPATEITRGMAMGVIFFAFVPVAYVVHLLRRGRIDTLDIRDRRRRTGPYLVGLASYAAAAVVFYQSGWTAAALLGALALCHVLNTALLIAVNLRWKISVHNAALAGFASMLFFVATTPWPTLAGIPPEGLFLRPLPILFLLGFLPLLMWARVRTGVHTPAQVAAGALVGFLFPYAELALFFRLGWL